MCFACGRVIWFPSSELNLAVVSALSTACGSSRDITLHHVQRHATYRLTMICVEYVWPPVRGGVCVFADLFWSVRVSCKAISHTAMKVNPLTCTDHCSCYYYCDVSLLPLLLLLLLLSTIITITNR